ncbi:MAG: ABC transporter permease, partial [Bacteroidetes bacterium]
MKYSIIFSIARTHLLTRKRQTIVAALGVTFGIASYVIMMGFMTGLNGLLDGMILNRTPHIHIYNELAPSKSQPIEKVSKYNEHKKIVRSVRPKRKQTRVRNANALMRELAALKEVKAVTPMVRAQGFYLAGSTQLSASLIGVDVLMESENYQLSDYIVGGKAENLATIDNGILLGIGAAKKMSVSSGDKIQVISPTGTIFQLKVVGFFQSGLADIDNIQSYVSLKTA